MYMGFGMQKENYKRKPKEAFGKTREKFGDMMEDYSTRKDVEKSDYNAIVNHHYTRNETPLVLRIIRTVIFLLVLGGVGSIIISRLL